MAINLAGRSLHADINITPLIDVLLVLIIIFMIIQPAASKGLEAVVPQESQNPIPPTRTIVVQLTADGSLHINQEAVATDRLGARLFEIFKARAEKVCFIRADPGIEFQAVARVIETIRDAGVQRIGLLGGNWK